MTLATGTIALTITFLTSVIKNAPSSTQLWIHMAWVGFVASVFFGVLTLMAMTGSIAKKNSTGADPSIYSSNISVPASLQLATFAIALAFTVIFGWYSLS